MFSNPSVRPLAFGVCPINSYPRITLSSITGSESVLCVREEGERFGRVEIIW